MSNFANPELDNYFRRVILPSNTSEFPSVVFANDLTKGLFWDTDGLHLTGLSATPTDNTEAASKAYVDSQAGGGGATTALDNLTTTAINADLNPEMGADIKLGSPDLPFNSLAISGQVYMADDTSIWLNTALDAVLTYNSSLPAIILNAFSGHAQLTMEETSMTITEGDKNRFQIDNSETDGDTSLVLYDAHSGSLKRVTVGAADSGGTGFKVLRIPN